MSNGGATYDGWLKKQGGYLMTTWQKRWFHLEGGTLYWSARQDDEPGTKGSGVLTAAYLGDMLVPGGAVDVHVEMKHATKKKENYVLRAPNFYEAETWCNCMKAAIAYAAEDAAKEISHSAFILVSGRSGCFLTVGRGKVFDLLFQ